MEINIDELIKDMNEVIIIENVVERVEKFLLLLPNEDLMSLMKNPDFLNKEQILSFGEILDKIRPNLLDYKFHLEAEKKKLEKMQKYIY
jgi:hypothetical protein